MRPLRDESSVAGFQALRGAVDRLLPLIAFAIGEVDVPIDQPRHHGCFAQIDHLGPSRNLHTNRRSDICNPVAPDEHHLIGKIGSRLRIEHSAGPNGDNLRTLWSLRRQPKRRHPSQQDGETNEHYQRSLQTHVALLLDS